MGIDIYMEGDTGLRDRKQELHGLFDEAVAKRNAAQALKDKAIADQKAAKEIQQQQGGRKYRNDEPDPQQVAIDAATEAEKAAQQVVSERYEALYKGSMGYLRSSYNSAGLFNVLDTIFGTDVGTLLFGSNWDRPIRWDVSEAQKFLDHVTMMEEVAKVLRDGDPLPVKFHELEAQRGESRAQGEAVGDLVMRTLSQLTGEQVGTAVSTESAESQRTFSHDQYDWYLTTGLENLREFGELGLKLAQEHREFYIRISY